MTGGFDVNAIRIEDERRVIVRMIMRPQARTAIVFPASLQGSFVERIHLRARRCGKSDVDAGAVRAAIAHPEEWFPILSIADAAGAPSALAAPP